ncbi:MAG TPA: class I SAM-dependent methyltransferase [Lacunisphaera sp.]|nr:class I SAM-dependent methyltransferase [Lacunisphaera sp.]
MCLACKTLDTSQVNAFAGRLLGMINAAGLSLMISIGHRTRLFDVMSTLPAADSVTIAGAAGLNERYVREWLGAMTTGGVVHHDAANGTYHLPAEHASLLTRAAPMNVAAATQFVAELGFIEDRVVECFEKGGGVRYEEYRHFHRLMAEDSGQTVVAALFDHILPLVPGIADRLEQGIDVLDLGCGRGHALATLARRFPQSRFVGIDFSADTIAWAQEQAASDALANLRYEVADAARFDRPASFDFVVTFDAIHDQARPDLVLKNIQRALRPDGVYLMQDIHSSSTHEGDKEHPLGPWLYAISTSHCMTVSLAHGGMGLGTMWGERTARRMLNEAGFGGVRMERLPHDIQNAYYVIHQPKD